MAALPAELHVRRRESSASTTPVTVTCSQRIAWDGAPHRLYWTSDGGASWTLVTHVPRDLNGPITFFNRLDGIVGKYPEYPRSEALCTGACR